MASTAADRATGQGPGGSGVGEVSRGPAPRCRQVSRRARQDPQGTGRQAQPAVQPQDHQDSAGGGGGGGPRGGRGAGPHPKPQSVSPRGPPPPSGRRPPPP